MSKGMATRHGGRSALRLSLAMFLIVVTLPAGFTQIAERASYAIGVDGLACPFCAYGIEKQMGRIDGVESVTTNIADGVVIVTMAEGAILEKSAARKPVADAGFTLGSFERRSSPQEQAQ